jgi:predicted TPR repeat methyltransferase
MSLLTDHGQITFSPGGEEWIEYGPPEARRRVAFHAYDAIYAVPGLYEAVFYDELGMCSADVIAGLYCDALEDLGRAPGDERVFDLGAGNGIGGEVLRREIGPERLVALDIEPTARDAAQRDREGVYDEYVVADLGADPDALERLRAERFSALMAVSAIGQGHIPLGVLADTIEALLPPGGLFAFAVFEGLLPAFHEEFFARVAAERLGERTYVHRRTADGGEVPATAIVARLS